jgi:hypothetical protein
LSSAVTQGVGAPTERSHSSLLDSLCSIATRTVFVIVS